MTKILDNKGQDDTFILYFEKALDTSPHELLKNNKFSYGINGKTFQWLNAFPCYRQQTYCCFFINGVKFGHCYVECPKWELFLAPCHSPCT